MKTFISILIAVAVVLLIGLLSTLLVHAVHGVVTH